MPREARAVSIASVLAFVFFCTAAALAAEAPEGAVTSGLRHPLPSVLDASPADRLVPVSVVLRDQAAPEHLRALRTGLGKDDARRAVISTLREMARRSQAGLLSRLRELERQGLVARIRPLWIGNVVGVDAVPAVVREIAMRPEVAWVNHNPKVDVSLEDFTPAPPRRLDTLPPPPRTDPFEIECGVGQMRAPSVWNELGTTGSGAVVAVIDTGVCHTHTDIANQIWVNPGEDLDHDGVVMDPDDQNGIDDDSNGFVDDLIGWDFDFNDNLPNDDNSHGSHCAGTVAGDGTAGSQCGMAPDAKIMAVKVGVSFADEVDVWNAMQYAADNHADTISMSLGWPHGQNPDRATWRQNCENTIEAGTAMVIAAGNEGSGAEPDNVRTPGDVPRVITVGATDCSDNITGFSSRGPVTWQSVPPYNDWPYPPGLVKPDISAPGDNTKSHDVCSGYSYKSGTSMATPHVAGAVALMVSASPGLSHDDLKQILEETAVDLGAPGKDNEYGSGRVDAYEAVLSTANPNGRINVKQTATSCHGLLDMTLTDSDLKGTGTATVTVTSAIEPAGESVSLTETGPTSGVFKGQISTDGGPAAGDGKIQVTHGDTVTATYIDANNGQGGTNVPKTDTASVDCVGPMISQVGESGITDVRAVVNWTTGEPSDSIVHWGETRPPSSTTSAGGLVTSHGVTLTGLQPCTVYYYSVESRDGQGNGTLDTNGGLYYYFETYGDLGAGLQPCHAGSVTLLRDVLSCSDSLAVKVVDLDLNTSSSVVDTVAVRMSSTMEPDGESVLLTETGPNTSQFQGAITLTPAGPSPGDGLLSSQNADLLSATYHDADDGTGTTAVAFDTSVADCASPGISGVRVTSITDETAVVQWNTAEPSTSRVDWGPTAALGRTVSDGTLTSAHSLLIQPITECGRFFFRVRSTDVYGNERVLDASGAPFEFNGSRIPGLFRDTFESSTGWTLEGEWQIAAPQAKGTPQPDPAAAFEGSKVLGHDLTGLGANPGNYEPQTIQRAISPVINATSLVNGEIFFRRWLNVAPGLSFSAVEVKKNGVWNQVWASSTLQGVTESAWSLQNLSIAQFADANAQLQIAFRQNGGQSSQSGWNVDRLVVKSGNDPDYTACGGCGGAPTFAGAESAKDLDGCADTGVRLTWQAAPGWGTGSDGTYAVYRDPSPTFSPSAANRIAAGIAATSYTDTTGANGANLYYVVRAENNETCSAGPNNGGTTDVNLVRLVARDDVTQPSPGSLGGSLRATGINDAHVRVSWTASPTAARYHVYRGPTPQGPFTKIAETTATFYEDRDQLGNANPYYYVAKPADACGNEGT